MTMMKAKRYGGAERAWASRAEWPMLVAGSAEYNIMLYLQGTYSLMIVGRKTGIELNATLHEKNINLSLLAYEESTHIWEIEIDTYSSQVALGILERLHYFIQIDPGPLPLLQPFAL